MQPVAIWTVKANAHFTARKSESESCNPVKNDARDHYNWGQSVGKFYRQLRAPPELIQIARPSATRPTIYASKT